MLQQTQVQTVVPYYQRFIQRFPSIKELAQAPVEEVLRLWAGLGYYSRARHLHASAQSLWQKYRGAFPDAREDWQTLKGVGQSTAAAIVAFAFNKQEAILDGNVKRILARVFLLPPTATLKDYWLLAESLLPEAEDMPVYTQGLMDLGALICKRQKPLCSLCPLITDCQAYQQNLVTYYPAPKKGPSVQEIHLFWPLIFKDKTLYLITRPKTGIWASLLSPPTFDSEQDLKNWLEEKQLSLGTRLSLLKHRLTHRQLLIHRYEIRCQSSWQKGEGNFYSLNHLINERIPKPLSTTLAFYIEDEKLF